MTKINLDKRLFCPLCRQYSMCILEQSYKIHDEGPMVTVMCYCTRCATEMTLKTEDDISRAQYSGVQTNLDEYGGSE